MIAVAVLIVPALALLLYGMDRFEDRLFGRPTARHARGRHLRLVDGTGDTGDAVERRRRGHRPDAA
ncbi:hypothetical protein [Streptomyces sp. NPDC060322]|uniref:hypothetical protein n=1 Tax=unclassified Streptomyces TaxID=2593676 RepID=UPI00364788AD